MDVGKIILAGGLGVVDLMVQASDVTNKRTVALKRWQDYFRIAAFAGGLATQVWMTKYARWGEAAAIAAAPLLVKSINDSVQVIKVSGVPGRTFVPSNQPAPANMRQRFPAPEYQDQFQGLNLT